MEGTIVALRSSDREVLWFDDDEADAITLFRAMEEWLVHGITFTILEYHPERKQLDVSGRSYWWDKQLRNQGYEIE